MFLVVYLGVSGEGDLGRDRGYDDLVWIWSDCAGEVVHMNGPESWVDRIASKYRDESRALSSGLEK